MWAVRSRDEYCFDKAERSFSPFPFAESKVGLAAVVILLICRENLFNGMRWCLLHVLPYPKNLLDSFCCYWDLELLFKHQLSRNSSFSILVLSPRGVFRNLKRRKSLNFSDGHLNLCLAKQQSRKMECFFKLNVCRVCLIPGSIESLRQLDGDIVGMFGEIAGFEVN